ncbi:Kunitz/Bovine pancreatic trypsin inhibitor domain protein [Oesophagostomum dentatum]|uniref:Kunitz/Bovine pancreatic trypsin inhibitor domain protein n=1 Tax=Oesophagostomum dentatum TaxID=61180 RepID=A0A0B1T2G0_OESDE|nr:Kunitz/Bovine pancreatic trypsin inhibitor domain protein [Oesophagostomum dentatum]
MFLVAAILGLLVISSFTQAQLEDLEDPLEEESVDVYTQAQLAELCHREVDQGYECYLPKPQIRYHYDNTTNECLSFLYKGCGGNINNYKEHSRCESVCKKGYDIPPCVDKKPPTGICHIMRPTCPEGSICKYGMSYDGVCCEYETEGQYRKEWKPKCDSGKVLITYDSGPKWVPLLGKKCSYEFCPERADCIEGKWFAHCCGSEERFGPEKLY